MECKFCTHQCECVANKNSSFTEEQVSRNLRIGPLDFLYRMKIHFKKSPTKRERNRRRTFNLRAEYMQT